MMLSLELENRRKVFKKSGFFVLVISLLMGIVFAVHFFYFKIASLPINPDDAQYYTAVSGCYENLKDLTNLLTILNGAYCPFSNLVLSLTLHLFGKSWLVYKMLNLLYYIVLIYAVYGIGKELGNRHVGLLAAFLAATMPIAVIMLRLNYPTYQLTAVSLLALLCLIRSQLFLNREQSILFGIFSTIALLVHPIGLIYILVIILGVMGGSRVFRVSLFDRRNRQRIINFLMVLFLIYCVVSPFRFYMSRSISPYLGSGMKALNQIQYIPASRAFYGVYKVISHIAIQISVVYFCIFVLIFIFTRPNRFYLIRPLYIIMVIFMFAFLVNSLGMQGTVAEKIRATIINLFIIFPVLAIVLSNSFILFFKRHKNRISKIFLYILIMAIVINGSLYLFPTNIDNKLLNKRGLGYSYAILSPYNYSVDDNFTINATSILIESSLFDDCEGKRIFVGHNRATPGIDSVSLYAFLEKGLYIDYATPQVLSTGDYYLVLEKEERDYESRATNSKEYHLLRRLMYEGEPFYIFKKSDSL